MPSGHEHHPRSQHHGQAPGPGHHPRWLCRLHAYLGMALSLVLLVHLGVGLLALDAQGYVAAVSRLRSSPGAAIALASMAVAVLVQLATGAARLVRGLVEPEGCSHGALGAAWQRGAALLVAGFVLLHLGRALTLGRPGPGATLAGAVEVMAPSAAGALPRLALTGFTLIATWALALHVANGWYGAARFLPLPAGPRARRAWAAGCLALGAALALAGSVAALALLVRAG